MDQAEDKLKTPDDDVEYLTEWPVNPGHTGNPQNYKHKLEEFDSVEKKLKRIRYNEEKEHLASTALAKWWRRSPRTMEGEGEITEYNPNTRMKMISRLPAAVDFMKKEIQRLRLKLSSGYVTGDVHAALGSFLEKNGQIELAVGHYQEASILEPQVKEYSWLLQKAKRIQRIKKIQLDNQYKIEEIPVVFPPSKQVERRSAKSFTVEDFYQNFECKNIPVIITDYQVTTVPWTFDHVKEKAGKCSVTLKKPMKHSVEWARLENSKTSSVSDFITHVQHATLDEPLYLFDWSLPLYCPDLSKEILIPKYFAGNLLQRTSEGSLYKDSWPSLFVAPAGITSELHVDAFGSHFWMALFQGKKRWVFFPKTDVPFLYPEYEHSLDPVFDVNLSRPDLEKHPLISLTSPSECILQQGEILFVPAGCPHRVENLESSIAISSNFIDGSNLDMAKEELKINSLLDVRSAELLKQFEQCLR